MVSSAFFGEPPEFSQSISGTFLTDDVGFISIAVAPSSQYISNFSIAAFDQHTDFIDGTGLVLNSISSTGLRYITVDLALPEPASSFLIFNQLVCGGGLALVDFPSSGWAR